MVATNHNRRLHSPSSHQLIESQSRFLTLTLSQPANPRRQSLKLNLLLSQSNPTLQTLVLGEQFQNLIVGHLDIMRIATQRHPSERTFALTKQRTNISRYKTRKIEGIFQPLFQSPTAQIVTIIKSNATHLLQFKHQLDVLHDGFVTQFSVFIRIILSQSICRFHVHFHRIIPNQRIMSTGLIR